MGRKAILKNLVDIVVMLKQDDDRAKKDQRNLERLRQLDELYGTNDAEEVEGLMGVRDAPDKVSQVRELGRIGELDSEEAKEVEGLMGVREAGKSSSQQPPSGAGQGSRTYTGNLSDDETKELNQGYTFSRKTGKRLVPEGDKTHPVTGKTIDFPTSGGPRNPDSPSPGRNLVDALGQAGEKAVQQARSSQQQPPKTSPTPQPSIPTVSPIPTPTPSESSTPTSTPTPSATPTVTPTPTPTAMPKPESTTPPKVLPKYAKETFSKAFPGFPQF
jgi:hypothetical protein